MVVVGGVNTDYAVRAATLPDPDHPVADGEFVQSCGGKGLNQAVAVARLGCRAALVARVGRDARGQDAVACLEHENVASRFVSRDPDLPTGVAVIQVDRDGRKQTAAALGANLRLTPGDIDAAADAIAHARVLLVQLEIPLACVDRSVQIARAHDVMVVLDPAPARPLPDRVIRGLTVIKPNASEARTLTGVEVRDVESARAAAHELRHRGVEHVVVSAGSGTLLLSEAAEHWYDNLPVDTVDTTGAGDAFAGALAVALLEDRPLRAAVGFAHRAAAVATTVAGALPSLPNRSRVDRLVASTQRQQKTLTGSATKTL